MSSILWIGSGARSVASETWVFRSKVGTSGAELGNERLLGQSVIYVTHVYQSFVRCTDARMVRGDLVDPIDCSEPRSAASGHRHSQAQLGNEGRGSQRARVEW